MILALTNVKGGVGKTTTAVNLAAAFANSELRVLVVDLDPQGSASACLGVAPKDLEPSMADVLMGEVEAADALVDTGINRFDLLTGSMALANVNIALARKKNGERRLIETLRPITRRYDFILIDCPPGLSLLTINALAAARAYILPVLPHELSFDAIDRFFEGLEGARGYLRRQPELLGILMTMIDHRTNMTDEMSRKIRRKHSGKVFRTTIPVNVTLAEATKHGMTIFEYERWSPGAHAYSRLGAEVLRRMRDQGLA
ncbi:MAG: ParA family protein [bacterium]|nr:ParA family protein [bacterium]